MKKVYATLLVAALGSSAMFAQTLSTVWTKTYDMKVGEIDPEAPNWSAAGAIKTQSGMITATGVDGKIYAIDQKTMSVVVFDENGSSKAFDLPSLDGKTVKHVSLNDAGDLVTSPDFYGSLITRDDAGHLLIGHAQGTGAACNYWTVLDRKTGETKDLSFEFSNYRACLPTNMVGRAVGDVTKEGYLYVAPSSIFWPEIKTLSWVAAANSHETLQLTKILSFSGNGTLAGTTMKGDLSGPMPLGAWIVNSCAPWYSTVEDMKAAMAADPANVTLNQTFFLYSKQFGQQGMTNIYGAMTGLLNPEKNYDLMPQFQNSSSDITGMNCSQYNGFDTFELGGERYYVASYESDTDFRNDGILRFSVFDKDGYQPFDGDYEWQFDGSWNDEAFEIVGVYNTYHVEGSMTINIEKVDEENVNIYVWAQCPESGVFAGMFNYGNGNTGLTGVNDVVVEANDEAPVYYNLNGVRVANPANGIFIEKRGDAVKKVVM